MLVHHDQTHPQGHVKRIIRFIGTDAPQSWTQRTAAETNDAGAAIVIPKARHSGEVSCAIPLYTIGRSRSCLTHHATSLRTALSKNAGSTHADTS